MASTNPLGSGAAPTDDSDLEDLIAKSPSATKSNVEMVNLENIAQDDYPRPIAPSGFLSVTPIGFLCGYFQLCCYHFPRVSKCLTYISIFGFIAFVSNIIFNPTKPLGIMGGDYTAITSAYDLSLSKVDHWCIQGDNDSCRCEDPLEATSRSEFKSWNAAHKANKADVEYYRAIFGSDPTKVDEELGGPRPQIDVAFLGESVVEAMDGRWLGKHVVSAMRSHPGLAGPEAIQDGPKIDKIFEKKFKKHKGAQFEGVALGIAGDTCSNVLWRIQHDEMPYDFNPKVWWVVLGMNDLTRMQCSEEIVVLGILRVVEEIRLRKPDAKIVINSLLPMIDFQSGDQPKMADFADFAAKDEGRGKYRKREVPATFKVRGNDDEKDEGDDDKRRRHLVENVGGEEIDLSETVRTLRKQRDEDADDRPAKKRTKKQRQQDEDNATEGPDLEAAIERKKKILAAKDKRVRDKVFKDTEKYHPKKPVNPLLPMIKKKVLPPVWPSVHLINSKLKEFCTKHESITFFDATHIFASDEGGGKHRLYDELISPRGHPTEQGFLQWEGEIMARLHKMLDAKPGKKLEVHAVKEPTDDDDDMVDEEPIPEPKIIGEGSEHVSEGKEASAPEIEKPDRRDESPESREEEVKNDDDEEEEEEETEEAEDGDDDEE